LLNPSQYIRAHISLTADVVRGSLQEEGAKEELSEEELLLTPAAVYGFSLSDKLWRKFNLALFGLD
jgi:hypothetical protein